VAVDHAAAEARHPRNGGADLIGGMPMMEREWLECADPTPMLEFLGCKASDRKLRLFACACCYQCRRIRNDERRQRAVRVAEEYADRTVAGDSLDSARVELVVMCDESTMEPAQTVLRRGPVLEIAEDTIWAIRELTALDINWDKPASAPFTFDEKRLANKTRGETRRVQATLIRWIFGFLSFRPITIYPAWQTATVVSLAQAIYDERAFDRLPILADALEDAGCTQEEILNHCRQPGEHVRGCWCVDLLLDKK
jgi:hypothetical protein